MAQRNGWNNYQRLVLTKLDDHSGHLDALTKEIGEMRSKDITDLKVEIAMLKIKAGVWGAAAGLVPGVIAAIYVLTRAG